MLSKMLVDDYAPLMDVHMIDDLNNENVSLQRDQPMAELLQYVRCNSVRTLHALPGGSREYLYTM